jgi:hypothetical protein
MAFLSIPLNGENQNTDEIALPDNLGAAVANGYVSELGYLHRRPGYEDFVDLVVGSGVTGIFPWSSQNKLIVTAGNQVFSITKDGVSTDITGTGIPLTAGKMTFADFGDDGLFCANGGQIIKVPTSGNTTFITDLDAPTQVSHVAVLNRKLIAKNGDDGRFDWSDSDTPESWSGAFATAEGAEDGLRGLYVSDERIRLFGTQTTETWRDTGSTDINSVFIPETQEYINRGSASQYAPAYCLNTWYWIDEFGNVVRLNGRFPQELPLQNPQGLTAFLQNFDFSDAIGNFLPVNGRYYYVVTFPSACKTIAYDIQLDRWAEWTTWDNLNAEDDLFQGSAFAFFPEWNQVFLGDRQVGMVYTLDANLFTDNGDIMRTVYRSAHMQRQHIRFLKRCLAVTGRVQRKNVSTPDETLKLLVRWRDDGDSVWEETEIDMAEEDGYDIRWELRRLGSYYTRQWEFVYTGNTELIFSPPMEEFEIGN